MLFQVSKCVVSIDVGVLIQLKGSKKKVDWGRYFLKLFFQHTSKVFVKK